MILNGRDLSLGVLRRRRVGGGGVLGFLHNGLFYGNIENTSAMFQDNAGTISAEIDAPVGRINDSWPSEDSVSQTLLANRPVYGEEGWLEFDGTDFLQIEAPWCQTPPFTFFGVFKTTAASAGALLSIANKDIDTIYYDIRIASGKIVIATRNPVITSAASTTSFNDGNPHVFVAQFLGGGYVCLRVDGQTVAAYNPDNPMTNTCNRVSVGRIGDISPALPYTGSIGSFGFVAGNLLPSEILRVESYMAGKYGITVSEQAPLKNITTIENATNSWWCNPPAVKVGSAVYDASVSSTGVIKVSKIENRVTTTVTLADLGNDEHNSPSILVQSDKPTICFYQNHNTDNLLRYQKSATNAGIDFTGEVTIDVGAVVSYSQVYREPETDNLILFYRRANAGWSFIQSDDYGATWSTSSPFVVLTGQTYMTCAQVGSTLRIAAVGDIGSGQNKIYYCELDLETGNLYKSDETLIGNISAGPYDETDLELVYDPVADSLVGCRLFSVSTATEPEIAFAKWSTDTDTVYGYAYRNGSTWTDKTIGNPGATIGQEASAHYVGGVEFPKPTSGGVVLVSREDSGTWYIEKLTTTDSGDTWAAEVIESNSVSKIYRPNGVVGDASLVVYSRGNFTNFNTYNADRVISPAS